MSNSQRFLIGFVLLGIAFFVVVAGVKTIAPRSAAIDSAVQDSVPPVAEQTENLPRQEIPTEVELGTPGPAEVVIGFVSRMSWVDIGFAALALLTIAFAWDNKNKQIELRNENARLSESIEEIRQRQIDNDYRQYDAPREAIVGHTETLQASAIDLNNYLKQAILLLVAREYRTDSETDCLSSENVSSVQSHFSSYIGGQLVPMRNSLREFTNSMVDKHIEELRSFLDAILELYIQVKSSISSEEQLRNVLEPIERWLEDLLKLLAERGILADGTSS